MTKLIIFGVSNFSRQLKWYIDNDDPRQVIGFCVDDQYFNEEEFQGLKVYKYSQLKDLKEDFQILIGVGYTKMNDVRKKIFEKCLADGFQIASYIHSSNLIQAESIGVGNIILERNIIQPFTAIGDGNLIWCGITIAHENKIGNFNTIAGASSLAGRVKIGDNCFVGNSACIRDGVNLGNYVLVGASAYVSDDLEDEAVIVPAKGVVLNGRSSKEFI